MARIHYVEEGRSRPGCGVNQGKNNGLARVAYTHAAERVTCKACLKLLAQATPKAVS